MNKEIPDASYGVENPYWEKKLEKLEKHYLKKLKQKDQKWNQILKEERELLEATMDELKTKDTYYEEKFKKCLPRKDVLEKNTDCFDKRVEEIRELEHKNFFVSMIYTMLSEADGRGKNKCLKQITDNWSKK